MAQIAVLILLPATAAATVRRDRPRMLLTPKALAELRRRAKTDPVSRDLFTAMKSRCDGMLRMTPRLDNQGRHYLPSYALLHAITGEARYAPLRDGV